MVLNVLGPSCYSTLLYPNTLQTQSNVLVDRSQVSDGRLHCAGLDHWCQQDGNVDMVRHAGVTAHGQEGGGAHAVTNVAHLSSTCH